MPSTPSTAPPAQSRATIEAEMEQLAQLSLQEEHEDGADEQLPLGATESKAKKRRHEKRTWKPKVSINATVEETDTSIEVDGFGGAHHEESNANDTSSPPSDTETVATEPLPQFRYAVPQLPRGHYIEVPVLAHYTLRELPSVGNDGDDADEGLFATQKIEAGTRVISEQPLFTLPAPGDQVPQLMAAYENLDKSDQESIWNLRPAAAEASDTLMSLRFLTDKLAMDLQNIMCKLEADRTAEEKATIAEMQPKFHRAMDVYRVAARWHANKCSLLDLPLEQRNDLPNGMPITGLFMRRAHIRHSCVPNCFASYDSNLGRMNVHVTRDIAPGEELTCSSFADNMYYNNAEERREELIPWGLTCDCEACDEKHPRFEIHETARERAYTRAIMLNDTLTRLEKEDMTEVRDSSHTHSFHT